MSARRHLLGVVTYLSREAARRLRRGLPWARREEILRVDGAAPPGVPAELRDEDGRSLGLGDVDLASAVAVRRLGLPDDAAEGLIPRQLRRALVRRATFVQDPRFCRVVNDDGDGLPGLVADRFGGHFAVQTFTPAMDSRLEELTRSLVEVAGAESVVLRNDSPRRAELGLPRQRTRVLHGRPPRWMSVQELGARMTVDLLQGAGTGYYYDQRRIRRVIARMSAGARVLDPCCFIGGLFVHAGLHGARGIVAFDLEPEAIELARENAEANGLAGKVELRVADAFEALEGPSGPFDLVLLDPPDLRAVRVDGDPFVALVRLCVRRVRRGGHLIVSGYAPLVPAAELDERVAQACEQEGRVAFRLARPGLPFDFPTVLGAPGGEPMSAVALEVS